MPEYAIKVEGLGKSYSIQHQQDAYATLRDSLSQGTKQVVRRLLRRDSDGTSRSEEFWALRDVSFEVQPGERLGVIGRNGAGKTTLLKVLSRITEPTRGRVRLRGRVSSLLEVGTGFHPELTGRENIYLNGAILGMTREEIRRKYDEIVAFAEVERFLDTPVKRYSSGMYVRLAFSVAAHLEPEILLVDEVLTVGDAAFQKKCLGKMGEVARGGRTILFVSHNMAAIESLCNRCIRLDGSKLVDEGTPEDVTSQYLAAIQDIKSVGTPADRNDRVGSGEGRFLDVRLLDSVGREVNQIRMGTGLTMTAHYDVRSPISNPVFGFLIADERGRIVLRAYSHESYDGDLTKLSHGGSVSVRIEALPLMYGNYHVHLWLSQNRYPIDYVEYAASFEVLRADVYGTGRPPDANNGGVCFGNHTWEFHP